MSTYQACSTRRSRRSRAEIEALKETIIKVVASDPPMTVRQIFYRLVAAGAIEKTEAQYQQTVVRLLTEMRIEGTIPFHWIVDHSRRRQVTETFDSVAEALEDTARFYRRSALKESPAYIEVWVEKEALSGVLWDVTSDYDVPLMASKGMPSITFLHSTAEAIRREWRYRGRPSFIYQFGDHDPTGALIPKTIENRLREFCPGIDFAVERVALTEEQIDEYSLPTRPTKREGNSHAKSFKGESVELDALPPSTLREMVREVIERHISPATLAMLRAAQESERDLLRNWVEQLEEGGGL